MTAIEKIIEFAVSKQNMTRQEIGTTKCYHWCMEFVKYVLENTLPVPATCNLTYSCTQSQANMTHSEYWSEPEDDIKAGDIIFYNWGHDYDSTGNLEHVGIVVEVTDTFIRTIEGNTEENLYGNMNSHVRLKTRTRASLNFNCEYPDYYMRYIDTSPNTEVHTSPADDFNTAVNRMEELLSELKNIYDKYSK